MWLHGDFEIFSVKAANYLPSVFNNALSAMTQKLSISVRAAIDHKYLTWHYLIETDKKQQKTFICIP